ncbi:MAG: DinB family protein [Planctomycetota bacterium]
MNLVQDLSAYNLWANERVFALCVDLADEQLDQTFPIGVGTLRATLFHLLAAETAWLERWQRMPWRSFPTDPQDLSVNDIRSRLREVGSRRTKYLDGEQDNDWSKIISYQDSKQTPYQHRLLDLILHVFNHGVHHRAQALNYLRRLECSVGAGIDYIFYRLDGAATPQSTDAQQMLSQYGMPYGTFDGGSVEWHTRAICRWTDYSDWATNRVLDWCDDLSASQLNQSFEVGHGSLRSTLNHMHDVERWWLDSLRGQPVSFGQHTDFASISELQKGWHSLAKERKDFLTTLDPASATVLAEVSFGGPPMHFQRTEGWLQVLNHGTHHRAQMINMLRRCDAPIQDIDLLYWLADE